MGQVCQDRLRTTLTENNYQICPLFSAGSVTDFPLKFKGGIASRLSLPKRSLKVFHQSLLVIFSDFHFSGILLFKSFVAFLIMFTV